MASTLFWEISQIYRTEGKTAQSLVSQSCCRVSAVCPSAEIYTSGSDKHLTSSVENAMATSGSCPSLCDTSQHRLDCGRTHPKWIAVKHPDFITAHQWPQPRALAEFTILKLQQGGTKKKKKKLKTSSSVKDRTKPKP